MKKIVIVPDSFKGTLSAADVCDTVAKAARTVFPAVDTVSVPVADGGEGTVDCFLALPGSRRCTVTVTGPRFAPMQAAYALLADGTAVVEMAAAAGLPLLGDRPDAVNTTTFGVGELIARALDGGARRVLLGLGGSCTNDAGAGAAAALGVRFLRADGSAFVPVGGTLGEVARIDVSSLDERLRQVPVTLMCDVTNPLYGERGCAYVFGPQKGADPATVRALDAGLRHMGALYDAICPGVSARPGAGAAGGLGAGMMALLAADAVSGIDAVLDTVRAEDLFADADLIVTGEGKFDSQSLGGKVISGVARRAGAVPVVVLAGGVALDAQTAAEAGVTASFACCPLPMPFEELIPHARENLRLTAENAFRLWALAEKDGTRVYL